MQEEELNMRLNGPGFDPTTAPPSHTVACSDHLAWGLTSNGYIGTVNKQYKAKYNTMHTVEFTIRDLIIRTYVSSQKWQVLHDLHVRS